MKILIVHQSQEFLNQQRDRFSKAGWQVHTWSSGLDGLMSLRYLQFDLIICALKLPIVSGAEVARVVRQNSGFRATSMILLSDDRPTFFELDYVRLLDASLLMESEVDAIEIEWFKSLVLANRKTEHIETFIESGQKPLGRPDLHTRKEL